MYQYHTESQTFYDPGTCIFKFNKFYQEEMVFINCVGWSFSSDFFSSLDIPIYVEHQACQILNKNWLYDGIFCSVMVMVLASMVLCVHQFHNQEIDMFINFMHVPFNKDCSWQPESLSEVCPT